MVVQKQFMLHIMKQLKKILRHNCFTSSFKIASRVGVFADLKAVKTQGTQSNKCITLFSLANYRKMQ